MVSLVAPVGEGLTRRLFFWGVLVPRIRVPIISAHTTPFSHLPQWTDPPPFAEVLESLSASCPTSLCTHLHRPKKTGETLVEDLLMVREGFTSSEYETYMELFQRLSAASWTWVR